LQNYVRTESTVRIILKRYANSDDVKRLPSLLDDQDRKILEKIVDRNNKTSTDMIQKFLAAAGQKFFY